MPASIIPLSAIGVALLSSATLLDAAVLPKRALAGTSNGAMYQDFVVNPSTTTAGKCAFQAGTLSGAWAAGGHNVALSSFDYADCGQCIKITDAVSGKSSYGFVVDQQNAGSMDLGPDILMELGVAVVQDNIKDTLNYEPAPGACQITWNHDCSTIGKTDQGGYCG